MSGLPNTLTDAEREAGWQLLFDGLSPNGWRGFRSERFPKEWSVVDGALHCPGGGGDVITEAAYGDFELSLEWRISPSGNSGIFLRVTEVEQYTFMTGTEFQIIDNDGHPDGRNPLTMVGSNYGLYAPAGNQCLAVPVGEWNRTSIVMHGPHCEFHLNGTKIVEFELWGPEWEARVKASKFAAWPAYGRAISGHIALQDHGDPVWFRSIKLRPL